MEGFPVENPNPQEKIIPPNPRLRYIEKTLALLNPETDEDGNETSWLRLSEKVGPWNSGMELSRNVRATVREYVAEKLPALKEKIPPLQDLEDEALLDALANGWFEGVQDEVGGKRKEVLLSVLSNITKKIETRIYKQIIGSASPETLQKLGLKENLKDLAIECLDTSAKADPFFTRYLAYSQFAPDAPEDADPTNPIGPDEKPHSFRELFPKESEFIANRFASISANKEQWANEPGAQEFAEYLSALSAYIGENDPAKTNDLRKAAVDRFNGVIQTDFPINIIAHIGGYENVEGYYKPAYVDPELRVVLRTEDSKAQEERFRNLQHALADDLGELGVAQFSEKMKVPEIRNYLSIGSYGVNTTFVAAAQSDPAIMMFLDEQERAYDKNLKPMLDLIEGSDEAFAGLSDDQIEEMSRTDTELHEFSHSVFPGLSEEAKRLGSEQQMVTAEAMAESVHRARTKSLMEKGALPYSKEQFVRMSIAMALQSLKDSSPDDEYFQADTFVLNGLFEKGLAEWNGEKIVVKDADGILAHFEENAKELVALYSNPDSSPEKAKQWIAKSCRPGERLQPIIDRLNKKEALEESET